MPIGVSHIRHLKVSKWGGPPSKYTKMHDLPLAGFASAPIAEVRGDNNPPIAAKPAP